MGLSADVVRYHIHRIVSDVSGRGYTVTVTDRTQVNHVFLSGHKPMVSNPHAHRLRLYSHQKSKLVSLTRIHHPSSTSSLTGPKCGLASATKRRFGMN